MNARLITEPITQGDETITPRTKYIVGQSHEHCATCYGTIDFNSPRSFCWEKPGHEPLIMCGWCASHWVKS